MKKSRQQTTKYFDIVDDFKKYPDAWCYVVIGGRSTGKTYSTLKYDYLNNIKFAFTKRTIEDVKLLCAKGKISEYQYDASPFKSINRDIGSNIQSRQISDKGLGAFYRVSGDDVYGEPVGYIISLSSQGKFSGFDFSECDHLITDEYIARPWDRVNSREGDQLLDLYITMARDRELRGKKPLKLILLANAVRLYCPINETLEITNTIADMQATGTEYTYDRGIMIHLLPDMYIDYSESPIYKAMAKTAWGRMAFDNSFAYDDVTNIRKKSIKGYHCIARVIYKDSEEWFIYRKGGDFIVNTSRAEHVPVYDFSKDNDLKRFNLDVRLRLLEALVDDRVSFSKYNQYYVINNFTKIYKI